MRFCFYLLFMISVVISSVAQATLGESETSVSLDVRALATTSWLTQEQNLRVHQIKLPTQQIRQYVNGQGVIFAVTWQGAVLPPMGQLLGRYFPEYSTALATRVRVPGQRYLQLSTPALQVRQQGPLMHLHGVAYLPEQVPAGLSVESLP